MSDVDFPKLLASLSHEGELHGLDRETRRRFKDWLWEHFEKTKPADTKAWAFIKQLNRLEDRDAIEDGAEPRAVYARNDFIPPRVIKRERLDFDEAAKRWEEGEL